MGINNGGYRGLKEDVPRLLYLTICSAFGGAVSSVAFLEEVYCWGGLSEVKSSCYFQFGSLCFMLVVEDCELSATSHYAHFLLLHSPAIMGSYPYGTINRRKLLCVLLRLLLL